MEIPRLPPGKGMVGPEYYDCCNTGRRPVILRSRATKKYIVGGELGVSEVRNSICFFPNANKRVFKVLGDTVKVFKTRKPAVAEFLRRCEEVNNFNRAEIEAKKKEREEFKKLSLGVQ